MNHSAIRQTSKDAYLKIKNGKFLSQKRFEIFDCLYQNHPMTSAEVFSIINLNKPRINSLSQSRARFSELRDMGVIIELGTKKCSITNNNAIVWEITGRLPKEFKKPLTKKQKVKNVLKKLDELILLPIDSIQLEKIEIIKNLVLKI